MSNYVLIAYPNENWRRFCNTCLLSDVYVNSWYDCRRHKPYGRCHYAEKFGHLMTKCQLKVVKKFEKFIVFIRVNGKGNINPKTFASHQPFTLSRHSLFIFSPFRVSQPNFRIWGLSFDDFRLCFGFYRRKIRLIKGNAKCRHLKKFTCKGTLRQVFIWGPEPKLLDEDTKELDVYKPRLREIWKASSLSLSLSLSEKKARRGRACDPVLRDIPTPRTSPRSLFAARDPPPPP